MMKLIRNYETGKYEYENVTIDLLCETITSLNVGIYTVRHESGWDMTTIDIRENCIVVESDVFYFYFTKSGSFETLIENETAKLLNVNFEENLKYVTDLIAMLNDKSSTKIW